MKVSSVAIRSWQPPGGASAQPGLRLSFAALQSCTASVDAVLIVLASVVGGIGYQLCVNADYGDINAFIGTGLIAALLYGLIVHSIGLYRMSSLASPRGDLWQVVALWSLVSLLLTLLAFLLKIGAAFSRGSIVCFAMLALVLLVASRALAKHLIRSAVAEGKIRGRRAILIAARDELVALDGFDLLQNFGVTEIGRVSFPSAGRDSLTIGPSDLEQLDQALKVARDSDADEIVLALPWSDPRRLDLIRDHLRSSPLPVRLLPDRHVRSLTHNPLYRFDKTLAVEVQRAPLQSWERAFKRAFDIVGASCALLMLLPLMLITALAIKLDSPGPVLFRQRRTGFNARQFAIFKFRTMTVMEDGPEITQACRGDDRVTRVGRILRTSSIDELPQLINVLIGDMSLVGPRPHAVAHDNLFGDLLSAYAFRHHVKPGITGWAQVHGYRGEIHRVEQMKARVEHDLWYINNWSMALDVRIAVLTFVELMRRRNAY
ncbi:undecaprenyl-phosphate glucose phosphotransferase [Bradyrhizobium sp. U87765 SZCCT0131]|uniref:undecaprenyl-phosphate glucose phosphotransferase n=1 Tax=unclassified Bradyrhizobium TaxID=2631580 RepID=UPI001BA6B37F|nr:MULTISPECIES: undecaprenyl-phosphate glucose phosphotransferase [unclassified Bradyrhizobium]MBR1217865.1 undecaprenyl-phosphate glucose phosphotransferase [Bradyrhizobium sp. U87765 SZCCT0131]MBR1261189.1 undecaprenyl-phosphate glucose phosphotransferase [Bradyrhizobium sp. U87765 SZCCT0134]MBR1303363.1 undecaprenyl-phosphate glucose phosphotransferase [Bradyrhizobium sp. U87765 SZCCT0110]MBR1318969.1 undecaprenyl-phosphate glucose phosphotransferase [Bradyrhizobium sp. U87765 SZCCT0109]MB